MAKDGKILVAVTNEPRLWVPGERPMRAPAMAAALAPVLERFARRYAQALRRATGADVAVAAVGWRRAVFGELLSGLPKDGLLNVLRAEALKSPALLVMAAPLLGAVTDVLLGGARDSRDVGESSRQRARPSLTSPSLSSSSPVTQRLARRFATVACDELGAAFGALCPGGIRLTRQETEPMLAAVMSDDTPALVAEVRLTLVGASYDLMFVWPEAALAQMSEPVEMPAALAPQLATTEVEVVGRLTELTITMRELLGLASGDVLLADAASDAPAELLVEGVVKLTGLAMATRGRRALKISA